MIRRIFLTIIFAITTVAQQDNLQFSKPTPTPGYTVYMQNITMLDGTATNFTFSNVPVKNLPILNTGAAPDIQNPLTPIISMKGSTSIRDDRGEIVTVHNVTVTNIISTYDSVLKDETMTMTNVKVDVSGERIVMYDGVVTNITSVDGILTKSTGRQTKFALKDRNNRKDITIEDGRVIDIVQTGGNYNSSRETWDNRQTSKDVEFLDAAVGSNHSTA